MYDACFSNGYVTRLSDWKREKLTPSNSFKKKEKKADDPYVNMNILKEINTDIWYESDGNFRYEKASYDLNLKPGASGINFNDYESMGSIVKRPGETIKVKLNLDIDINKNVYILDNQGKKLRNDGIKSAYLDSSNSKTIIIEPDIYSFNELRPYYLVISSNIKSIQGTNLQKPVICRVTTPKR